MTSDPDAGGFHFIGNVLHAGDVSLETLAESCGTPSYVYNAGMIRQRIAALQGAFAAALPPDKRPLLAYACKANTNGAILRLMAAQGLGADVVSGGEMRRALKAGIPADKIVFSGVGKTEEETTAAIQNEIRQINTESAAELERLIDLHPPYPLRIAFRLNPDVEPGTHAKISTGQGGSKFGLPADEISNLMDRARRHKNLLPAGLSVHIGSQLTSLAPYRAAFTRVADLAPGLRSGATPWEASATKTVLARSGGRIFFTGNDGATGHELWSVPVPLGFHPVTPCRVADTRDPAGPAGGIPLGSAQSLILPVTDRCDIPSPAVSVAANITVVSPTVTGSLSVFAGGPIVSGTTEVPVTAGKTRALNAIPLLGTTGSLSVRASLPEGGTTHVVLDVSGYFE